MDISPHLPATGSDQPGPPVTLRRAERAFCDQPAIRDILQRAEVGQLGLVDAAGPYVIPVSYGVTAGENGLTIYLHGAGEGRKIAALEYDPRVCFEVAIRQGLGGTEGDVCHLTAYYESAIGFGRGRIVTDPAERRAGLMAVIEHYAPGRGYEVPDPVPEAVTVLALDLTAWSGKRNLVGVSDSE